MDTIIKPESPRQEIRRMKLVARHFERLSAASRLYLAAHLLNTTQAELERRGFHVR